MMKPRIAVVLVGLAFAGGALAQSPALTAPNNSAGTPLDAPSVITRTDTLPPLPTRTESSSTAFDKLDVQRRGYVTRAQVAPLPGTLDFDDADRNRDERLDPGEFQRFWSDYQSAGQ